MPGDIKPVRPITEMQRDLARHALGLPNKSRRSYRNHFVIGEGCDEHEAWVDMVSLGLARRRPGSALTGGDDLFRLTTDGAKAVLARRETLCPEDFPNA